MSHGGSGEGTNRLRLQLEFGQWSEIPLQKTDRTLFTNWSLKFQRGIGTRVTSGLCSPLTFSPGGAAD